MVSTEERLQKEADFQDKKVTEKDERTQHFYYKIYAGQLDAVYNAAFDEIGRVEGKSLLEVGCGEGHFSLQFARLGARVTATDISPESIKFLQANADQEDLTDLTAYVSNAEALDFPGESFDIVFGSAILHHLELSTAVPEICRVLKKGGKAIFVEPLGHNPLINLYRIFTPSLRTPDEHPIVMNDFRLFKQYVGKVYFRAFYLTTIFALFWRFVIPSERMFSLSFSFFEKIDRVLFSVIPLIKRYARTSLIVIEK